MILIIVVLSEYCKLQALAVEIVIHPEGSNYCKEIGIIAQCYPISSLYTDNPNRLEIASNTTFLFQPGVYFLESSILIQDVRHITIHLLHDNPSTDINDLSQIYCENRSGLFFINTTNVIILDVIMNNCGTNISQILMQEDTACTTNTVKIPKFELCKLGKDSDICCKCAQFDHIWYNYQWQPWIWSPGSQHFGRLIHPGIIV